MHSQQKRLWSVFAAAWLAVAGQSAQAQESAPFWQSGESTEAEQWLPEPMPPGFEVVATELEGPVFATAAGKTLYIWPRAGLRNGSAGDQRNSGVSTCGDTIYRQTAGLMSPYPPGLLLPELEQRRSCDQLWPAVLAERDARPVGKWTLIARANGARQWAYDGYPVYTSHLDQRRGDVLGGVKYDKSGFRGEYGALRAAIGPQPDIPPEFQVVAMSTGRILVARKGLLSIYVSDADEPGKSNCTGACLNTWQPVPAPELARDRGEWSIVQRSPGIRQWAYRGRPLYIHLPEVAGVVSQARMIGSDVPGWHNVYTQRALSPPPGFTVHDADLGRVLADAAGKTVYVYNCNDDALDQQSCNHPDSPQAYRLAVCGNGDPERCMNTFPYVIATPGARSQSRLWTVMTIDKNTGRRALPGQPGALDVWAYRDRPVYTFGRDNPGDTGGHGWGEFNGYRNGYRAFWLRDDYRTNALH